jgi:hypothetical protein
LTERSLLLQIVGINADSMRRHLADTPLEEISRDYLNFYARHFPAIRIAAPLSTADDGDRNVVTVIERYEIEDLWLKDQATFPDSSIGRHLPDPTIRQRTMPLAVAHPVRARRRLVVDAPQNSIDEPERSETRTAAGRLLYRSHPVENRVLVDFDYESLTDRIAGKDVANFLEENEAMRDILTRWLRLDRSPPPSKEGPWVIGVSLVIIAVAALALMRIGPRTVWRALRSRRRRKSFARSFAHAPGGAPSSPLPVNGRDDVAAAVARLACGCGASRTLSAASAPEELRLGDVVVLAVRARCGRCAAERSVYCRTSGA